MIDYRVRSISLLSLVNEVNSGRLISDAYFQRNLVWRDLHKKDFIKTILMGLPFPQLFLSKGKVDIDSMTTTSCIVDGQQRTNAIIEFINGKLLVDRKSFSDLSGDEKAHFLKYEIAIIELDLENDNPKVQEIFQRINRTSNSLTAIEKMASQYSASEFMLVAKLLSDQVEFPNKNTEDFRIDPNIPEDFYVWAKRKNTKKFIQLLTTKKIFTVGQISKKVHLQHTLNIMSAYLGNIFNRNEKSSDYLDDYAFSFPRRDEVVDILEESAKIILDLKLKIKSYWYNKANFFTLMVAISNIVSSEKKLDISLLKERLEEFEKNIPKEYKISATEGVNNTKERLLRNKYVEEILESCLI